MLMSRKFNYTVTSLIKNVCTALRSWAIQFEYGLLYILSGILTPTLIQNNHVRRPNGISQQSHNAP
jgi:hypothetical protein